MEEGKRKSKERTKGRVKGKGEMVPHVLVQYKMMPKSASVMCYALLLFTVLMNERVNHSQS